MSDDPNEVFLEAFGASRTPKEPPPAPQPPPEDDTVQFARDWAQKVFERANSAYAPTVQQGAGYALAQMDMARQQRAAALEAMKAQRNRNAYEDYLRQQQQLQQRYPTGMKDKPPVDPPPDPNEAFMADWSWLAKKIGRWLLRRKKR